MLQADPMLLGQEFKGTMMNPMPACDLRGGQADSFMHLFQSHESIQVNEQLIFRSPEN